jgi:tetratricopeptide (TPR) repeat protein
MIFFMWRCSPTIGHPQKGYRGAGKKIKFFFPAFLFCINVILTTHKGRPRSSSQSPPVNLSGNHAALPDNLFSGTILPAAFSTAFINSAPKLHKSRTAMTKPPKKIFCLSLLLLVLLGACSSSDRQKDDHFRKGMHHLQSGKAKASIFEFRKVLQIDPLAAEARYRLALALLTTGEPQAAWQELNKTIYLAPDHIDALYKTAEILSQTGPLEASTERLARVLAAEPRHREALLLAADINLRQGRTRDAEAIVHRVLAEHPEWDRAYATYARIYTADGQELLAEGALQRALKLNPGNPINHQVLTNFYLERRKTEQGEKQLQEMTDSFPALVWPLHELAILFSSKGREDQAEEALMEAVRRQPKNESSYMLLADLYRRQNDAAKAEAIYRRGLRHIGIDSRANLRAALAELYFEQRQFDQANREVEKILTADASHSLGNLLKAKLLLMEERPRESLEILSLLAEDHPRWAETFYYQAAAFLTMADLPSAEKAAAKAVEYAPANARFRTLLARLYLLQRRFDAAQEEAAAALELKPTHFRAALVLGESLLQAGEYGKALTIFDWMLASVPQDAQVLQLKGMALLGLHEQEAARSVFEKILAGDPHHSPALAAIALSYLAEGNTPAAVERVRMQAAAVPANGGHKLLLAHLLHQEDELAEALALAIEVQRLAPETPKAYQLAASILQQQDAIEQAIAHYRTLATTRTASIRGQIGLGMLLAQTGDHSGAMMAYRNILATNPDSVAAACNLAWLITREQDADLNEALRLATLAKGKAPHDPHVNDTLGWVHYRRGAYELAAAQFAEAIAAAPRSSIYRYHLALTLAAMEQKELARAELQQALTGDLPFPDREQAILLLENM